MWVEFDPSTPAGEPSKKITETQPDVRFSPLQPALQIAESGDNPRASGQRLAGGKHLCAHAREVAEIRQFDRVLKLAEGYSRPGTLTPV